MTGEDLSYFVGSVSLFLEPTYESQKRQAKKIQHIAGFFWIPARCPE